MRGTCSVATIVATVVACGSPSPIKPRSPVATPAAEPPRPTQPTWTPPPQPTPTDLPLAVASEKPERCSIRVSDRGITVDGDAMAGGPAVTLCKQRSAALVELADGASQAEWKLLHAALVAAGVTIMMRGAPAHDGDCQNNPLAKGCM